MSSTKQLFANNAATTVALPGVSPTDTQITVADASKFNNPAGTGKYIKVTLENSGVIEVVKISNISGNVLTVFNGLAGRAQEGTVAGTFPFGAKVENRTTAGTLAEFLTASNYLPKLTSADGLSVPTEMDSTAYMAGKDDGGAFVLAYADTNVLWNFPTYRRVSGLGGTTASGSTTTANIGAHSLSYVAGKYIIQFTNGANQGYCRAITGIAGNVVSWSTALPAAITTNTFEIYQSTYSVTSGSTLPDADIKYRGNATTANGVAFTVITTPSFTSFIDGLEVKAYMSGTNYGSTAPTLTASGSPARTIVKLDNKALALNELNGEVVFRYNLALDKWVYVSGAAVSPGPELQSQTSTAFTTSTSATNYVLTPTPAITANAANQRFRVKFHAAVVGTPTLNVSAVGQLNLKYKDATGTKQACTAAQIPINWISDVENDGTDWVLLERADRAGTSTVQTWSAAQAGVYTPLTDAATIATNLATSNNFYVVLGGNRTLGVPTNPTVGQSGVIDVYQDITGGRTLAYAWCWQFPGGVAPSVSTGKVQKDTLAYLVQQYNVLAGVTMTSANPCVVTWANHGLRTGDRVVFTTAGFLPTNVVSGTVYYVTVVSSSTFRISTTLANCQNAVFIDSTAGTNSGTHTGTNYAITAQLITGTNS